MRIKSNRTLTTLILLLWITACGSGTDTTVSSPSPGTPELGEQLQTPTDTQEIVPSSPTSTSPPAPSPTSTLIPDDSSLITELVRLGHGTTNHIEYSPDGSILAVAGSLGMWLYEPSTGEPQSFLEMDEPVTCVAWLPNGQALAFGTVGGRVWTWDMESEKPEKVFEDEKLIIHSLAWDLAGQLLAVGGDDGILRIWDVAREDLYFSESAADPWEIDVAWSPDGTSLAAAGASSKVSVWDTKNWTKTRPFSVNYEWYRGAPLFYAESIAWSIDGTKLAVYSTDGNLWIWDANSSELISTIQLPEGIFADVSWSPDGQQLAVSSQGVKVLQVGTWNVVANYAHESRVHSLTWSPDSNFLATATDQDVVRVWSVDQGTLVQKMAGFTASVRRVNWSPDNLLLASGYDDGIVRIWDPSTEQEHIALEAHSGWFGDIDWSPDGTKLASIGYDEIRIWDVENWETLHVMNNAYNIDTVAWSDGGSQLATGGWNSEVRLWDVETWQQVDFLNVEITYPSMGGGDGDRLAWLPSSSTLASINLISGVWIWDTRYSKLDRAYDCGENTTVSVAWSPDGNELACVNDIGTVRIIDTKTGFALAEYQGRGAAWSGNGRWLALWRRDGTIQIRSGDSWEEIFITLEGHNAWVTYVVWSSDSTTLASASEDGTIRIWGNFTEP